jgi:hypothetical protein
LRWYRRAGFLSREWYRSQQVGRSTPSAVTV